MSGIPSCLRLARFLVDKPGISSNFRRLKFDVPSAATISKQKRNLFYSTASTSSDSKPQEPQPSDKPVDGQEAQAQNPQIEELNKALQELSKHRDELNDKYKRALAEGENMRKRLTKQIEDAKIYGIQSFCKDLLEVADVLSKATECVPKEEIKDSNPHLKNLFEGLSMTEAQLQKVFKRHGLTEVNPLNEKFNPNLHEALFQQEVEGSEPGTVVVVSKIGYKLHERVIRPALVGVSKG
ncbi:hypothetical protein GE061_007455 [Apolygus lucorum]|uniref:GrpE protein homolog n=1 Tax=Apolygus lucorum TaxID=248454 RepID=A0A6A4IRW6_APOLU|nr:hypothetical protein GE061_007455 [Apolygus lucorum]